MDDNNTTQRCQPTLTPRETEKLILELSVFLVLMYILFYLKPWKSRSPDTMTTLLSIDIEIEDLLDLTDTEDSSSSSHQVFEGHRPFVLELHELKKDDPANPQTEADKKKKKKKKNKLASNRSNSSASSSSLSESSIPPTVADAVAKEQFYDAHESFHGITENRPTAVTTLALSHSEHTPSPNIMDALPNPTTPNQPSSAVSKQVPRPE